MDSNLSQYADVAPLPLVVDAEDRIDHLKELLTDELLQGQKANIVKLIQLYETGEMEPPGVGEEIWLCDGEVIDYEPSYEEVAEHAILIETTAMQIRQVA